MSNRTRIVLAGGGTAGHVNPLLAVADAIRSIEPDAEITVIGTEVGLEHDLVPQAGYPLEVIEKVPFPRRPNAYMLKFPAKWARATRTVRGILERSKAQIVVGFGGYASAPVYAAAHRMGVPIVIHEQNARAGMANKLGARWASLVGTAFEGTGLSVREGAHLERVGLPLRPAIAQLCQSMEHDRAQVRLQAAQRLGIDPNRPTVVVTGGSLGALSLNRAVSASAKELLEHAQIIHLTGKGKGDEVRANVVTLAGEDALGDLDLSRIDGPAASGGDYHVAEYLERIDLAFACADLVVCRAGAGTVCELSALGLPAVYVPLPIGNGEQRFNAQPVVDAQGGLMVPDADFTAEWVQQHLPSMLANRQRLETYGRNAWQYGIRNAAQTMAKYVLDMAR